MKELAADVVIPIDKLDYSKHKEQIKHLIPGGFDTVIEATSVSELLEETINYAMMGGQVIAYGVYPEDA